MELGLTSFADARRDPVTGEGISHGERLRNVVEEIVKADEVGLDAYGLGEHHRADMAASAPAITLAAAAARTEHIRLGSAVIVLSSADPVRTFQDFATLDQISSGRAELMVGRGSFIESFPLFGYSLEDYDALFTEKLEMLLAIRESERVTWRGEFRAPIQDQGVYPRPFQDPLPISVGVGGTPASVVRAGRLGLPVVLAIIGGEPARFRGLIDLYRQTLVENDYDPADFPVAVHAHGHVAEDTDQAAEEVFPSYAAMMTQIGRERGWPSMTRQQYDAMRSPNGSLVVGDPGYVASKILQWKEWLDIERFMLHNPAQLPHEKNLNSIELLGKEVSAIVRGR